MGVKEPLSLGGSDPKEKSTGRRGCRDFLSGVVKEKVRVHFPRRNQGRETHQKKHSRIKAVWLNGEAGPAHMGRYRPY